MGKIPSHYQLKKENPDHYVISDQRDNTEFPIAKKGLDDQMHSKIKKMRHYDEGTTAGPVGSAADDAKQSGKDKKSYEPGSADDLSEITKAVDSGAGWLAGDPSGGNKFSQRDVASGPSQSSGGATGSWETTPDAIPAATSPAQSSPPIQTPNVSPNIQNQFDANAAGEVAGLRAQANAKNAQAADEAKAIQGSNDLQQKVFDDSQARAKDWNAKLDDLSNQVAAGKVDPNQYVNNMSTGNKIAAAIAIGLGGIGAGLAGQPNQAAEVLNKAIAKDVEAQKENIANKKTLYSENLARFGDEQKATAATITQLGALAQGKLAQIAQQRQGGLNDANYQIMASQLKNKNLIESHQLHQMVSQDKMRDDLTKGGAQTGADPLAYVRFVVPEAQQKQAISEIGQAQAASQNEQKMMDVFDQANKENTVLKTGAGLARTPPSIKVFNALADPLIHDNEGRINELEQRHIQALAPAPGDASSTIEEKRQGLQDFINHKKEAPTAKAFGIDVNKFNSTKTIQRSPYEGKTASDANGNKIVMKNGQWVALGK